MKRKLTCSAIFALRLSALIGLFGLITMQFAQAQEPFIYPAKGQSAEQQSKDKSACQGWATQQTGIDPAQLKEAPPVAASGNAGEGNSSSAGRQGLLRKIKQAKGQQAQAQQAQAQQQAISQKTDTYERAYGACLQGKGYSIN